MSYNSSGIVFAEKPSIGIEPTRLYDASRFKNHGTHNSVTMVQLPSRLWVRYLDGTDDFVTVTNKPELSALSKLSVHIWMKCNNEKANETLISKYNHSDKREWVLYLMEATPKLMFYLFDQSEGANISGSVTVDVIDNTWHCLDCGWAGATNGTDIFWFLDGVSQSVSVGTAGTFIAVEDTTQDILIGRQGNLTARDYYGYFALPEIVNYIPSAGQIKNTFEKERQWFGV